MIEKLDLKAIKNDLKTVLSGILGGIIVVFWILMMMEMTGEINYVPEFYEIAIASVFLVLYIVVFANWIFERYTVDEEEIRD
jgi:uncharacterized membrane protein YdbT with pleckstrin-like domain